MIDDALGDEVRVTVIAAGFDGGMPKRREHEPGRPASRRRQRAGATSRAAAADRPRSRGRPATPRQPRAGARRPRPATGGASPRPEPPAAGRAPVQFDDDDLDVPDFLK